jgi:hypothetical protein
MTTFTMQDLNNIPVTKEEDEAMDALSRLATGRPLLDITPTTQDALNNLAIPQPAPTPLQVPWWFRVAQVLPVR